MKKYIKIAEVFLVLSVFFALIHAPEYALEISLTVLSFLFGLSALRDFRKHQTVNKKNNVSLRAFMAAAFVTKLIVCGFALALYFLLSRALSALGWYEIIFGVETLTAAVIGIAAAAGALLYFCRHWITQKDKMLTFRLLGVKVNENEIITAGRK